jgi:hypothetical protein
MERNRFRRLVLCVLAAVFLQCPSSADAQRRREPPKQTAGPFGFQLGVPPKQLDQNLNDSARVGAAWVRLTGPTGIRWEEIEPSPGLHHWAATDRAVTAANRRGFKVIATIQAGNKAYHSRQGYLPRDMLAYGRFLTRLVERYDGDGTDDAPGSPVVDVWQIENEVNHREYWHDSMANYAKLLRESHQTIKAANPDAQVAIAGILDATGLPKYREIMKHLYGGRYFDIFDAHWNCYCGGSYKLQMALGRGHIPIDQYLSEIRAFLNSTHYRTVPIWVTEASTSDSANPFNNERTQADDLVRRLVYLARKGVPVVLWYHMRDYAWNDKPENYYSRCGLIHKNGAKKLAYFSYQLLTEKLAGCDMRRIEVIEETSTVRVYKFRKTSGRRTTPVWVLWNDGLGIRTYSLDVGPAKRVRITQAVPRDGVFRGTEIRDPAKAFPERIVISGRGRIQVKLPPDVPFYVEWAQ